MAKKSCRDEDPRDAHLKGLWTGEDRDAAQAEGWDIFDADGSEDGRWQLQHLANPQETPSLGYTEPKFTDDGEAALHVQAKAHEGSRLHIRAINFLIKAESGDVKKFHLSLPRPHGILVGCTTTDSTGYFDYAFIELDEKLAKYLLGLKDLFDYALTKDSSLYCVECFDGAATWCDSAQVELPDQKWHQINGSDLWMEESDNKVTAETIKATNGGVLWSASPKYSDGYFETRELSWDLIQRFANGEKDLFTKAEGE
jgi:hypothetical protein